MDCSSDNGEPLFPNAEVILHEDDVTFWSDPALRDGRSAAAMPYLDSAAVFLKAYEGRIRTSRAARSSPGDHAAALARPYARP